MASNVTAQSVLEKISEGHLECSICTNRFRQPKLLDCLHTFCLQCLQELRQRQRLSGTKLTCPLCKCETMLKGSGVADLPNNFAFSALVEEVTMQEKLLEDHGSEIKCQNCDEENQAISRCMDCDHFLCQECQKAHEHMTLMKSHKIYTLAQLRSGEIVYKSKLREKVPKCSKHPEQNLDVYCNSCQEVICTTCSVFEHAKHSLNGSDAVEKCEKKVQALVQKIERKQTEWNITIQATSKCRNELDTMFANTQKKIAKKAQQEITKIQKEVAKLQKKEQILMKETDRIYKDRIKALEAAQANISTELTQTQHKLEEIKQLMNEASRFQILELQQKLLHNLRELKGKRPQQVPDKLTFMDFKEGKRSLGRLILEEEPKAAAKQSPRPGRSCVKEKWELKNIVTNFGLANAYLAHVSALSNNEIIAVSQHASRDGEIFTVIKPHRQHASSPIPQWHPLTDFSNVRCIAVSKDDNLLALDDAVVKVFNKHHKFLHQFTPGRGSDKPTCLAVDDNYLIAVGYEGKEEISLHVHNLNGSLIRRLTARMIGGYLTMYNQRLIYTNKAKKRLAGVDYYGASVFSVDMSSNIQEDGYPTGVCCDSDGSIYVAVVSEETGGILHSPDVAVKKSLTGAILHYNPDGKYIGCVLQGSGSPRGITFTSSGDLLMAAGQSVQIYHRV